MKIYLIFLFMICNFNYLTAQYSKVSKIKNDINYLWGEDYGLKTDNQVRNNALFNLCKKIKRVFKYNYSKEVEFNNKDEKSNTKLNIYDNTNCNIFSYEEYYDEINKAWFICIKKEIIEKNFQYRREKVNNYMIKALKTTDYSEKLRFFYWSKILLNNIPGGDTLLIRNTKKQTVFAIDWVNDEIKNILDNIKCYTHIKYGENIENSTNIYINFKIFNQPFKNFNFMYQYNGLDYKNLKCDEGEYPIPFNFNDLNNLNKKIKLTIDYTYYNFTDDNELKDILAPDFKSFDFIQSAEKKIEIPFGNLEIKNIPNNCTIKIDNNEVIYSNNSYSKNYLQGTYFVQISKRKHFPQKINLSIYENQTKTIDLLNSNYKLSKYRYGFAGNGVVSMIIPGLGSYYTSKRGGNFWKTFFFFASAGMAYYFYNKTNQDRENYLAEKDPLLINKYYNDAQNNHNLALACSFVAGSIYIIDVLHAFHKGSKNQKKFNYLKNR